MERSTLDFMPELSQSVTVLPDDLPPPIQREKLPPELLKSNTIESLIAQNEDLMARLKVTLRRLALLETENQRLSAENMREKQISSSATDQLLILREKDGLWRQKFEETEKEKNTIQEKLNEIQGLYSFLQAQNERFQKYHERIKQHVKPFVQELKQYSKKLEARLQSQEEEFNKKEAMISDLRHQIIEITKNSKYQIDHLEQRHWDLSAHYDTLLEKFNKENESLKELNENLSKRLEQLKAFQQRSDVLENETIELRRRIDEIQERHQYEFESQREYTQEREREITRLTIEHQDVKDRLLEELDVRKSMEKQNFDLRHQLDSLRFMWNAKNDENEKLKQSLEALERLNVDLSAKLQEIRSSSVSVSTTASSITAGISTTGTNSTGL